MSKGSLFWANATGKLGESVFYRAGGEQRNRTYVRNIKNPRSRAQMMNRITMSNFTNIFRAFMEVIRLSFTTRPSNQSGFNAFVKANKTASSPVIEKNGASQGLGVPFMMRVSEGNITAFGAHGVHTANGQAPSVPFVGYIVGQRNYQIDDDFNKAMSGIGANADGVGSVGSDLTKLNYLYQAIGLPTDAVINVLWAQYEDEGYKMGINSYSLSAISVTNSEFNLAAIRPKSVEVGDFGFGVAMDSDTDELMCAVIVSYKVDGKIDVTTASVIPQVESREFSGQFLPGGELYDSIISQYSASTALTSSGSYVELPALPEEEP